MIAQANILVVGRHEKIMETVLRLINGQPGWKANGALTDDEAIRHYSQQSFDLVLIGGGVEESSEALLMARFKSYNAEVKMIRHYGGGSGLLFNEIEEALKNKN